MSRQWIPWADGDPIPESGEYWVTAGGIGYTNAVYKELLGHYDWRSWRYNGVVAYMTRGDKKLDQDRPNIFAVGVQKELKT